MEKKESIDEFKEAIVVTALKIAKGYLDSDELPKTSELKDLVTLIDTIEKSKGIKDTANEFQALMDEYKE